MTVHSLQDFLTGLDFADTMRVSRDIALYGNAFVEVVDGNKRRVTPNDWPNRIYVKQGTTEVTPA